MKTFADMAQLVLDEIANCLKSIDDEAIERLMQAILTAPRIFVAGKGRTGMQMRAFALRLMHLGHMVYVIDETVTPAIRVSDLLIIGSASGRTASLVQYAQRAKALGARVVVITASPSSPVAGHAELILRLDAPSPKIEQNEARSIQPEGTLFEQTLLLMLDTLVLRLMEYHSISEADMFSRHANLE